MVVYVAPLLLGSGRSAVGDLRIDTMHDALRLDVTDVTVLPAAEDGQTDVRITLKPTKGSS